MLEAKGILDLGFILLFNCQGLIFFSTILKTYGQSFIEGDKILSLVGSFGSIFNATAMLCLCALFTVLMSTFNLTKLADGKALFFIYDCLTLGTFSGNYSLIPTATASTFGQEYFIETYGMLFSSQMVIAPVGALLTSNLADLIGWYGLFLFIRSMFCLQFRINVFFNKKIPVKTCNIKSQVYVN